MRMQSDENARSANATRMTIDSSLGRVVLFALTLLLTQSLVMPVHASAHQPWQVAAIHLDAASTRKATRLAAGPSNAKPEPATSDSRVRAMVLLIAAIMILLTIAGRQMSTGNAARAWTSAVLVSALTAAGTSLLRMFPFVLTGPATQSAAEVLHPISCAALAALIGVRLVSRLSKSVKNTGLSRMTRATPQRLTTMAKPRVAAHSGHLSQPHRFVGNG